MICLVYQKWKYFIHIIFNKIFSSKIIIYLFIFSIFFIYYYIAKLKSSFTIFTSHSFQKFSLFIYISNMKDIYTCFEYLILFFNLIQNICIGCAFILIQNICIRCTRSLKLRVSEKYYHSSAFLFIVKTLSIHTGRHNIKRSIKPYFSFFNFKKIFLLLYYQVLNYKIVSSYLFLLKLFFSWTI